MRSIVVVYVSLCTCMCVCVCGLVAPVASVPPSSIDRSLRAYVVSDRRGCDCPPEVRAVG